MEGEGGGSIVQVFFFSFPFSSSISSSGSLKSVPVATAFYMHELNLTCLKAVEELCKREKSSGILDTISDSASARVIKASKTLFDMII